VFNLFALQSAFMTVVTLALFALQAWAFVDALTRRPDAFVAADKLTKPAWMIILGIALAAHMLIWNPVSILNLAGAVAAIVYLVDARPALQSLTRR
jgi:asparagine N-glycosylation enzyme membrane subunit Stt3